MISKSERDLAKKLSLKDESHMFAESYDVGVRPFCNVDSSFCIPGFELTDKTSDGCISGVRGKCKFNLDMYKKTGPYKELVLKKGEDFANANIPTKFYEYGTAPFCAGSFCDAILANKYPIATIKGPCWTGNKVIAIDPVADFQFKKINDFESQCLTSQDKNTDMWMQFWKSIAESAKLVGQIV